MSHHKLCQQNFSPQIQQPIEDPDENCFFLNTNIFETKIGAKKKCIKGMEQIDCAEFGAKMFVWVRDTAANVMYYAMGNLLHSYVGSATALSMIQMKMAFLQNTNIFKTKIGAKKKCINSMEQITQRLPVPNLGQKCLFGREIRLRM